MQSVKSWEVCRSRAFLVAQMVKNLPAVQETWVRFLGWDDPLEKEMAIHFNPMDKGAWQTTVHGVARVGHNLVIKPPPYIYIYIYIREGNGNPLQYSCLENGRRKWKFFSCHGWRSLVGCSPWDRKESDITERLPFHFSLSCIGEGNGNPLQCSCLENPRDGRAWWAAVYGVAQSRTRLKRLSSR